jgi:cell division ATPase FtsA
VMCGGAAQTVGMADTIKDSLRVPVRIAQPKGASGLIEEVTSPAFSAAVGTVIYGARVGGDSRRRPMLKGGGFGGLGKVGSWFKGFMP